MTTVILCSTDMAGQYIGKLNKNKIHMISEKIAKKAVNSQVLCKKIISLVAKEKSVLQFKRAF